MKWLPLHLRRQVHISSYMFKVIKGESPNNFINKFKYISGGSRDRSNCKLYTPKSPNLKNFFIWVPSRDKRKSRLFCPKIAIPQFLTDYT